MDEPEVRVIHPSMEEDLKPKRKYVRRAPRGPKVKLVPRTLSAEATEPPKPSKEEMLFAGMTPKTCATACNPETGCVITGNICAQPHTSGGLQSVHRMNPKIIARFEAAKDYLKHQAINQRKEG